jgi:hypothetical protein
MGILSGQGSVLNEGNHNMGLIDSITNCVNLLNDCSSIKEHNKACKLLVNVLGKRLLDLNDDSLFNINVYDTLKPRTLGRLKSSTKSVLVYTPPRGGRAALIHIFNAIKTYDNVKIEASGFCSSLGEHFFDIYDDTVAFDITDETFATYLLGEQLKIFLWCYDKD